MKVLQIHTRYREPGGEDTVVEAEAALLETAGHTVVRYEAVNPQGARTAPALALSAWNPARGREVAALVRRERPDVAHVHNTWYAMSTAVPAAVAGLGVPVVATLHNYRRMCVNASLYRDGSPCEDCVGDRPWHGVRHRCYRDSAVASAAGAVGIRLQQRTGVLDRSVDLFLALNDFSRERFLRSGLAAEQVEVHPNFVADPGPRPAPPSASRTVLVVGRVEQLKGVDVLVEAWDRARPADLELVVVGDGQDRERLEARQVPGVRFAGRLGRDEVRSAMLSARALALPSVWYEGQPMTVLEAMSCALPVLASDLGGTPDLLRPAGAGWLVPPGDPAAWAEALTRLDARRLDVDAAGVTLRGRYEADHTGPAALRRLSSVYERVARR